MKTIQEFSTGSVISFIMSTYEDLGDLQSLRIWHDNSGEGTFASWYLNQIDVYDFQRHKTLVKQKVIVIYIYIKKRKFIALNILFCNCYCFEFLIIDILGEVDFGRFQVT